MILVTGGTGLVGSHLLLQLAKADKTVIAIKRKTSDLDFVKKVFSWYESNYEVLFNKIQWIDCDLNDINNLNKLLKGVTYVYHCAAFVSFRPSDVKLMFETNVEGTKNLVNACLNHNIKKFCHVSSIAALGRSDEEGQLITEKTEWENSNNNSNYAKSKYQSEKEVWRASAEGLPVVVVYPSVILGPGKWNNGSPELIQIIDKGLKFYTTGINGFVDVKDVVNAMIALTESSSVNENFILSGDNISYHELFNHIADNLNKKRPFVKVNALLGSIAWRVIWLKSKLFNTKASITKETVRTSRLTFYYSTEKIQKTINFSFTPIKKTIEDICKIYLYDVKGK